MRRTTAAAAAVVALLPRAARGDELGYLGYDARSASVAGASVALGSSPSAVYTNPALLPGVGDQVSAGFLVFRTLVSVDPMAARGGVPRSVYDSTLGLDQGLSTRPLPTAELSAQRGPTSIDTVDYRLGLGGAARLWGGRLAVGAVVGLPVLGGDRSNVTTHYADEREANFSNRVWPLRLGGFQRVADAVAGAAWQPVPWLSFGLAGQVEATAVAKIGVYVPDASVQDQVSSTMTTEITTSTRPILGARARLLDWHGHQIVAGLVARGASYFKVDAESDVTLWNYHEAGSSPTQLKRSRQVIPVVFGYRPLEVALGLGGRAGPFEAEITVTWQRWSAYLDQHGQHPEQAAAFPAGYAPGVPFDAGRFAFRDVVAPAAGLRWRAAPWFELSAGLSYQPTPAPPQVGRTSYADSDLWIAALGQRLSAGRWAFDATLQLWMLAPRTTNKDPNLIVDEVPDRTRSLRGGSKMAEMEGLQSNNPGFPGYRQRGALLGGSVFVTRSF